MTPKSGAGRKPKENPLKVTNFRLSNYDLKLIDKKGIGRNSSERLRFILEHYKNTKLNISKRRKAYKIRKFDDFTEALELFNTLKEQWNKQDKLQFLCSTPLRNDILTEIEEAYRWKIRTVPFFIKLEQYGWFIPQAEFTWSQKTITGCRLTMINNSRKLTLTITEDSEEFIVHPEDAEEDYDFSPKEEDLLSQLYEQIQMLLFETDFIQEERLTDYKKEYPGGDFYRSIEYNHVVVIEMDYNRAKNNASVNFIKELDDSQA